MVRRYLKWSTSGRLMRWTFISFSQGATWSLWTPVGPRTEREITSSWLLSQAPCGWQTIPEMVDLCHLWRPGHPRHLLRSVGPVVLRPQYIASVVRLLRLFYTGNVQVMHTCCFLVQRKSLTVYSCVTAVTALNKRRRCEWRLSHVSVTYQSRV